MAKQITLREYEFLQTKEASKSNYINKKTFEILENFIISNEETLLYLKITTKTGYGKVLQAQNFCGIIQTKDGTTIEIIPKVKNTTQEEAKNILLKMLKTLKKSPFKHLKSTKLSSSKMPLFEIFISMFLDELAELVQKGLKSQYIQKEKNLYFLKGKLNISKQIKNNHIHKERFFVSYDEFLSDRVENRLIKSTLVYLYNKSILNKNQQRIREFLFIFDEIKQSQNIKADFLKVRLDKQMREYEIVLEFSKIFLFGNSFTPYNGKNIAFALLFDMNLLFESYVGAYLKKKGFDIKLQDRGKYLVEKPNKFALRPDIVINKNKDNEIIADTKYKNITSSKDISQADMYQLYAYGTKYKKTSQLYLIYPKNSELKLDRYSYIKDELHLDILFFDLKCGFRQDIGFEM